MGGAYSAYSRTKSIVFESQYEHGQLLRVRWEYAGPLFSWPLPKIMALHLFPGPDMNIPKPKCFFEFSSCRGAILSKNAHHGSMACLGDFSIHSGYFLLHRLAILLMYKCDHEREIPRTGANLERRMHHVFRMPMLRCASGHVGKAVFLSECVLVSETLHFSHDKQNFCGCLVSYYGMLSLQSQEEQICFGTTLSRKWHVVLRLWAFIIVSPSKMTHNWTHAFNTAFDYIDVCLEAHTAEALCKNLFLQICIGMKQPWLENEARRQYSHFPPWTPLSCPCVNVKDTCIGSMFSGDLPSLGTGLKPAESGNFPTTNI